VDLTREVHYRSFALNSVSLDADTQDMLGCEITGVEMGGVLGVGYDEKRAMEDGYNASDVYLGKRIINLNGNLYGRTRPEAFSKYLTLMDTLSPRDAYEDDPENKGFLPLDFYLPTTDTTNWPTGLIHVFVLARPVAQPVVRFSSDRHGGADNQALAIPWEARLECKDPRLYSYDLNTYPLDGSAGASLPLTNLGNRPAPIALRLVVPFNVNGGSAGTFTLNAGAIDALVISEPHTVAGGDNLAIIDYASLEKVLTWEFFVRMDLLSFTLGSHPFLVPGLTTVSWAQVGSKNLLAGSVLTFRHTWS